MDILNIKDIHLEYNSIFLIASINEKHLNHLPSEFSPVLLGKRKKQLVFSVAGELTKELEEKLHHYNYEARFGKLNLGYFCCCSQYQPNLDITLVTYFLD